MTIVVESRRTTGATLAKLDYETNGDLRDLRRPLSHAALIKQYIEGSWPTF